jgi:small subunit ribosomal protein S4
LETGEELKRRQSAPGQHGANRRSKLSNYGLQLREKQRIRFTYGVNERQFYNTFVKASKMKGVTGQNFLFLLESRLDNVVYRMGLGRTRRAARQLVNHGHIIVNGRKVDIPSYIVAPGSIIEVKETSLNMPAIADALLATLNTPAFVSFNKDTKKGTYLRLPERNEINADFVEALVVEYYNR